MKKHRRYLFASVLSMFLLGGCATSPIPGTTVEDDYHISIERLLDDTVGAIPFQDRASRAYRELRLLRGQLIVGIVARYGVARIEDFSSDRKADATKLLGLVEIAERAMLKARTVVESEGAFFNVYRTDVLFAVVDMAGAALEPTVRGLRLFVVSTSPFERIRLGKELLRNVMEDKLYGKAYKDDFAAVLARVQNASGRSNDKDWQEVSAHLADACTRLNNIVGKTTDCVPANLKTAPKPKP